MDSAPMRAFNWAHMMTHGLCALDDGLSDAPEELSPESAIPMARWRDPLFGAVLYLRYSPREDGTFTPGVIRGVFRREAGSWTTLPHWSGSGWSHDPLYSPLVDDDFAGRAIIVGGGSFSATPRAGQPAMVVCGRHSRAVATLAVTQAETSVTMNADGLWGAWIVCLAHWAPYAISALDEKGVEVGRLEGPHPIADSRFDG